jgi:hypothetical protein
MDDEYNHGYIEIDKASFDAFEAYCMSQNDKINQINNLLPELWHIIFELSNNQELNILNQCCRNFNAETVKILKSRRLKYPRIGKHVKHLIPFSVSENLDKSLKYLYNNGNDLVKGDIVYSTDDNYHTIYDGNKLLKYYNMYWEPIELDETFDIVKDNVPFDYWDIFNSFHVDLSPYIDQFNIKYDLLSNIVDCHSDYKNNYVLYIKFNKYFIMLDSDEIKKKDLDNGKIKESKMSKIINLFKKELENFYCNINSDFGPTTLLMSIDY